ncbi:hypothetical protein [Nocardia sp. NRRL S-836]|uniref:hypothetical protein n=1 Tax=Nocardia sp. NRRL S-836 TaxID=1519492 RepID=UPI0006AD9C8E|nr:hypothetical protein [Nocardia sp. NRRL S-836]KOV76921.1 hypothetical protein ADL03_42595 [Nocardia sp. NRRL S-836]
MGEGPCGGAWPLRSGGLRAVWWLVCGVAVRLAAAVVTTGVTLWVVGAVAVRSAGAVARRLPAAAAWRVAGALARPVTASTAGDLRLSVDRTSGARLCLAGAGAFGPGRKMCR